MVTLTMANGTGDFYGVTPGGPVTAVAGVETVTVTPAAAAPTDGKLFVRVEATP